MRVSGEVDDADASGMMGVNEQCTREGQKWLQLRLLLLTDADGHGEDLVLF